MCKQADSLPRVTLKADCPRLDFSGGVHRIRAPRSDAGIAQLVEHDLAKVGVASSSLVSRSKFIFYRQGTAVSWTTFVSPAWHLKSAFDTTNYFLHRDDASGFAPGTYGKQSAS